MPILDSSGTIVAASAIARDISERRTDESLRERIEEAIRLINIDLAHRAYHDALTDLPNRVLFIDQLRQALARARRAHTRVAVLLLDLNHFKQINDTFGHHAGDAVLVEIAQRLRTAVREADTVARWGGDEFTIILNDVGKRERIVHAVNRIMANFNAPVKLPDREATVTVKIGIAVFPTDEANPDDLIRRADHAMYQAQGDSKNVFAFSGRIAKGGGKSSQRNRGRN